MKQGFPLDSARPLPALLQRAHGLSGALNEDLFVQRREAIHGLGKSLFHLRQPSIAGRISSKTRTRSGFLAQPEKPRL